MRIRDPGREPLHGGHARAGRITSHQAVGDPRLRRKTPDRNSSSAIRTTRTARTAQARTEVVSQRFGGRRLADWLAELGGRGATFTGAGSGGGAAGTLTVGPACGWGVERGAG